MPLNMPAAKPININIIIVCTDMSGFIILPEEQQHQYSN
jgi:hypothetical protein